MIKKIDFHLIFIKKELQLNSYTNFVLELIY